MQPVTTTEEYETFAVVVRNEVKSLRDSKGRAVRFAERLNQMYREYGDLERAFVRRVRVKYTVTKVLEFCDADGLEWSDDEAPAGSEAGDHVEGA